MTKKMAETKVSGGISITLRKNGDSLNTTLNATAPLYQTFRKGTNDFSPNWATMADAQRPVIFPRVYSVMEAAVLAVTDITWQYNGVGMTFDSSGICTYPDVAAGKVRQIDYNGSKALKMIGNVASDTNNDSDTIGFIGKANATGEQVTVSAEITLLVEESSANIYRLFLNMDDDVIDGDETQVTVTAALFLSGAQVSTGVQYEFLKLDGTVLRAKNASPTFNVTRAMIDSELMVVCKAYVNNVVVAQDQRKVFDSTDPFVILCDKGMNAWQYASENVTYTFSVMNFRTGSTVSGVVFDIAVYKNSNKSNITSQFTKTNTSITIPGAKIMEHDSIYVSVSTTIS